MITARSFKKLFLRKSALLAELVSLVLKMKPCSQINPLQSPTDSCLPLEEENSAGSDQLPSLKCFPQMHNCSLKRLVS